MNRYKKYGIRHIRLIFSCFVFFWLLSTGVCAAQPSLSLESSTGFTAENSAQVAMTFSANPFSVDDESEIIVNFCSNLPTPASSITVQIKKDPSGIFTSIPSGTDVATITDHTISYSIAESPTGSPSPPPTCPESGKLEMSILIIHDHSGPVTETWHLRLENMGETSKYEVSTSGAALTNIHLLPTAMNTSTSYTREERDTFVDMGGGSDVNIWPVITPALSYAWTQDSGPVIAFPSLTGDTLQVLPPPATKLPSVGNDTKYDFTLTVTDSTVPDHGNLVNQETVSLNVTALDGKDVMLILDHSGSMLSENKWQITRQAASLFMDLYRALRNDDAAASDASEKSKIGHMKFESSSCGWGTATPETASDLDIGLALTDLDSLPVFQPVDSAYSSAPWGCTPIGDALDLAKDTFNSDGTANRDNPIFVLMTDGMENSGKYKISDVRSDVSTWPALLRDATFHTLGVGTSVDELELQTLASSTGSSEGVYRKATKLSNQQVQEFFVEILGDILKAQQLLPESGGTDSSQSFQMNQGETRIGFILLWDRTVDGPYYPKLELPGTWASDINWNNASGFSNVRVSHQVAGADGYAFMVIDSESDQALHGTWQVDFANAAGAKATVPTGANPRIIVIVDPHLYADFSFDSNVHQTGDPIILRADIREGGRAVLGANVKVELIQPAEGEGTFLATNSKRYQIAKQKNTAGDVQTPRNAMLSQLLAQMDKDALSMTTNGITLYDDGAHQDGAKNDGLYANTYTDTLKEGTYTFEYRATGTTLSGDTFRRMETRCNYVGVNVESVSSPTSSQILPPSDGLQRVKVFITPKDLNGEYLGPFRTSLIAFDISRGTLVGDVVDHQNGSYSQVIAYASGQPVTVVPVINGERFSPLGTGQIDDEKKMDFVHILLFLILFLILIFVVLIYRCACLKR